MSDIDELFHMQRVLMDNVPAPHWDESMQHKITCALGSIEEAIEYINSIGRKPWRATPLPPENQLEELVDGLHFLVEQIIRSPFTWDNIMVEYRRKHLINLKRYADVAKGDLSWDDKGTKGEL